MLREGCVHRNSVSACLLRTNCWASITTTHSAPASAIVSQSGKIATNSIVSVVQIGLTAIISLLTTRILLRTVGFVDYGILTTVGATGFLTAVLAGGLNVAALRNLSFEIGRGEDSKLRETFSSTLAVFASLGLILIAGGAAIQNWVFDSLTIPSDRLAVAKYAYYFVLIGWGVSSVSAPYKALRQAHQDLTSLAVYALLDKAILLLALLAIPFCGGDELFLFALAVLIVATVLAVALVVHCYISYPQARPAISSIDQFEIRRVVNFASWSLVSMLAAQMRMQLALIVMNIQFGPLVNAAYALAIGANEMVMRVSNAVHQSLQPAMTTTHASGDAVKLQRMISIGSRYAVFSVLPIYVPIMLEIELFLELWLGKYPDGAPLFARMVTTNTAIALLINGYGLAVVSIGKVAESALVVVPTQFLAFGISVIGVAFFDAPAWSIPAWSIGGMVVQTVVYALYFGESLGFSITRWLREVVVPVATIGLIGFTCGIGPSYLMQPSFTRLVCVGVCAGLALVASAWAIGIPNDEKTLLKTYARQRVSGFAFPTRKRYDK